MQLTKHTDLSLRVLMLLALKPAESLTIADVATQYGESKNHLVKVVHRLAALGYVNTTRGRGGGLSLSKNPTDITVGEVVRKMENTLDVIDCSAAGCPLEPACHLKGILDDATDAFLKVLDQQTIADLVKNRRQLLRLVG